MDKIQQIMEKLYPHIKGSPLYKSLQKNKEEMSKDFIHCMKRILNREIKQISEETASNLKFVRRRTFAKRSSGIYKNKLY